ncbi:hypothetical protein MPTK1_5g17300 [Marchantia polymorpha subsp. ruderalis]|uniref:HIG1 domain-containing protein n=2 Tax=Marchantia polymorpha TaxID=3197 RepID=A0AAF6BJA7_MARPO|nr:hypothetical protein MARPO_0182s0019 [Marchantia polymorpha]BBN12091.1 hypothetical protein Mp_5g17300 [Marchantia polymorpha subsp. ruderalis]|eukprot:PTQ27843.1 hypothetical protein MARPO_0182s0019 [Marchantia polymorpha]
MAEEGTLAQMRHWFVEHKLRAVGSLWATSVAGSLAYNFSNPNMKTSVKVIHARLHAQALTLAALAGAAVVEYYDHKSGEKAKRYEKQVQQA